MNILHEPSLKHSVTDLAIASPLPTEAQIRSRLYNTAGTVILCSADLLRSIIRTPAHHTLIDLPSRDVTLRSREDLKPSSLAEGDDTAIRRLLIQSRGTVRYRGNDQCQRCLLELGPFVGCISLPGTDGGACGNCAAIEYSEQCIYHKYYNPGGTPVHARPPSTAVHRFGGDRSLRSLSPHRYFAANGWVNVRSHRLSGDGVTHVSFEEEPPTLPALPEAVESGEETDLDRTSVIATRQKFNPSIEGDHASLYNATPRSTPPLSTLGTEQPSTQLQHEVGLFPAIQPVERLETSAAGDTTHRVDTPLANSTISMYKQTHTTLRVTLRPDTGFVPVKLRSCVTMSTLFATLVAACDLEGQEESVAGVAVRFDWLLDQSAMVIKKKLPDSFVEFLETIDQAPCWPLGVDGGKCCVAVEVFLKGG